MKCLTKFSIVAASCALLGAAAAQADDQQLTNRLAIQRQQDEAQRATTVAVYAGNGAAVGNRDVQGQDATQVVYEFRPSGHGQLIGMYRAVLP